MKIPAIRRLDGRGVAHHFLLPVIAVIAVAAIGAITLKLIHADTTSVMLYQGSCAQKYQLIPNNSSDNASCVKQAQELVDIYQYAVTSHFPITAGNSGGIFSYESKMTMLTLNGSYNGATQNAVNTLSGSTSLTSATSAASKGTWENFCDTVAAKKSTDAFTKHATYNFGGGNTINTTGTTVFNVVCGSLIAKSFPSTGNATGSAMLTAALKFTGFSYAHGGHESSASAWLAACKTPTKSNTGCEVDCTGLVNASVYLATGKWYDWIVDSNGYMELGGSVDNTHWKTVSLADARPGDLVMANDHVEMVEKGSGSWSNIRTFGAHSYGSTDGDQNLASYLNPIRLLRYNP